MKKIILILSALLLFCILQTRAQDDEAIIIKLRNNSKNKYLKDFKVDLGPQSFKQYSIVLSKNIMYEVSWFPSDNIMVKLYKEKGGNSLVPANAKIENNIITTKYNIAETAAYKIEVRNKTSDNIKSGILLSLVEKYEKDEVVIPITARKNEEKKSHSAEDELFFVVEEMPAFSYTENDFSTTDFKEYIAYELNYPKEAKDKKIEGRVFIQFTINKEGYVKDAKVMRGVHPALDQEALRIIYSSPKWKPGRQRGHAVNVSQTYPVEFDLKNQ